MSGEPNTYELTYIINPVLDDDHTKSLVDRVDKFIADNDGEVIEKDVLGSRRLAYQIDKKRNGYFVNLYFRAPGEAIPRIERALQLEDNILRYLTIRMDARMLRHRESVKEAAAREEAAEKAQAEAEATADEE